MKTINNTIIVDAKKKLTNNINEILQSGLPIAVVDLILDGIVSEVKTVLQNHLQQEAKQMAEQRQIESEQVEWSPETN